ncbi:MAG: transcription antitermination factor NusB, partial [Clostridia bacterium]
ILFMDKIPQSAAVDETVKAAKIFADDRRAGFINGVLRNVCRLKDELIQQINAADDSIKYSLDYNMALMIKAQYPDKYNQIFESFFVKMPLFLRVNTLKTDTVSLAKKLGNDMTILEYNANTIIIRTGQYDILQQIDDGEFFVQGTSSQYAVELLGAVENDFVIDVCACPGGKSLGAAINMKNKGKVLALDLHENKFSLIKKSASLLGISIIETQKNDSRQTIEEYTGKADKVICDVPCSGLGVIASKPEIKYKDVSDLSPLIKTQYDILCASSRYVKDGGTLVYSTCTINKNENEAQTERFLRDHENFELVSQKQFLPCDGEYDGFFAAKFIKK